MQSQTTTNLNKYNVATIARKIGAAYVHFTGTYISQQNLLPPLFEMNFLDGILINSAHIIFIVET